MPSDRDTGRGGVLTLLVPIVALAICCGGPLPLGLLASAGIGAAVVGGPLPLAAILLAAVLVVVGAIWLVRRRGPGADCCAVPTETVRQQRSERLPR